MWLSAGAAVYYRVLAGENPQRDLEMLAAAYRRAALKGDQPLSQLHIDPRSATWRRIADSKGALMLDALRRDLGDAGFFELMKRFFDANTTKTVTTASFRASAESAAGKSLGALFDTWLNSKGLPGDKGGATYVAGAIRDRLATAILVYGTNADAEQTATRRSNCRTGSSRCESTPFRS